MFTIKRCHEFTRHRCPCGQKGCDKWIIEPTGANNMFTDEDSRFLIAAAKACAGVETEALEGIHLKGLVETLAGVFRTRLQGKRK